jgi:hypothetical protein
MVKDVKRKESLLIEGYKADFKSAQKVIYFSGGSNNQIVSKIVLHPRMYGCQIIKYQEDTNSPLRPNQQHIIPSLPQVRSRGPLRLEVCTIVTVKVWGLVKARRGWQPDWWWRSIAENISASQTSQ